MTPLNFSVGAHPLWSQYSHNAGQTSSETSPRATLETDISSRGESVAASKKATDSQMQLLHRARSFSPRQSLPNHDVGSQPLNRSIPPLSDILSMYGPKPGKDYRSQTIPIVKTMDKVLSPDVDISQEVLDAMEACAVWFIRSTTAEAVRILNSSPTQRATIKGDTLLKAIANNNFRRYARALRPCLERFENEKEEAKPKKRKSRNSNHEEDSAKTPSSIGVTRSEVSLVPGQIQTSKRKRTSEGNIGSEANSTPTENPTTGGIMGSAPTWTPDENDMPAWTSISQGPRMLGGHGPPSGHRTTGEYEPLQRSGMPARYGRDGTGSQRATTSSWRTGTGGERLRRVP